MCLEIKLTKLIFLQIEYGDFKRAKSIYYRALQQCPWVKVKKIIFLSFNPICVNPFLFIVTLSRWNPLFWPKPFIRSIFARISWCHDWKGIKITNTNWRDWNVVTESKFKLKLTSRLNLISSRIQVKSTSKIKNFQKKSIL